MNRDGGCTTPNGPEADGDVSRPCERSLLFAHHRLEQQRAKVHSWMFPLDREGTAAIDYTAASSRLHLPPVFRFVAAQKNTQDSRASGCGLGRFLVPPSRMACSMTSP